MDPVPAPKQNTLPIKTILLILLGAAIAIWFILQRNKPRESSGNPPISHGGGFGNDTSEGSTVPAPDPKQVSGAQDERVERYPMLDSPDSVAADQEFPIQVSLTEQQQTPKLRS